MFSWVSEGWRGPRPDHGLDHCSGGRMQHSLCGELVTLSEELRCRP